MSGRGFILIPVLLTLTVIGVIAFLLNREGGMNANIAGGEGRLDQARYVAEAGLRHTQWLMSQNTSCTGYTDLQATTFADGSYSTTVNPKSGSPVTIAASATLSDGSAYTLTRSDVPVQGAQTNTITLQPDGVDGKDAYIDITGSGKNYGTGNVLRLRTNYDLPLIEFDLSPIPSGSRVTMAELRLYQSSNGGGAGNVTAYRLNRGWVEGTQNGGGAADGVTWTTIDAVQPWVTPGGDYDPTPAASTSDITGAGWKTFDLTNLVMEWLSGITPNYGVLLNASAGVGNIQYDSSDANTAATRPKLVVTYACECGVTNCSTSGPMAAVHWKLDEGMGIVASDSVGNNHGTLTNGPTWTLGKLGAATRFDGVDDSVPVPHSADLSLTEGITLMAWINSNNLSNFHTVIIKGNSINGGNYRFGTDGRKLNFSFQDGAIRQFKTSDLKLKTATWYHIAATFDNANDTVRIYRNGTPVGSWSTTRQPTTNTQILNIGGNQSGEYWNGVLDDVRIYNRALSAAEIAAVATKSDQTLTLNAVADTLLDQEKPTTNYGGTSRLKIGTTPAGLIYRSMYRFDVSSLPANATVTAADLSLSITGTEGSGAMDVNAHRVTNNWVESTATWNNTGGGVFDPIAVATLNVPISTGRREWLLPPALIHEWLDGISPNYGFLMQYTGTTNGLQVQPATREDSSSNRPKLIINYTTP
jgi:Tfp pilus assembly protein PilX